mmetsp:Transcript_22564/g.22398  ORF Transcript_22564/g.22398 Transcript_22564/m.22398 type:complete len:219 (+) Transcript_22564:285-941(+)
MMIVQHKVRVNFPILHKIFFLSSIDPIVKKIKGLGIFLLTLLFISYFFILIVVLFFVNTLETSDINTKNARRAPPSTRNLEKEAIETREPNSAYVIPFVLSFLLITYWINKIIISLFFWSVVLFILFILFLFYSVIYCIYQKEIRQREEEQRQRAIQNRYAVNSESISNDSPDEESKEDSSSSESFSSSESSSIINQVIRSMKKTFSMKKSKKKDGLG